MQTDHTNMTLAEAKKWAWANSHPETRARLRSRSVAFILLQEILRLEQELATRHQITDFEKSC